MVQQGKSRRGRRKRASSGSRETIFSSGTIEKKGDSDSSICSPGYACPAYFNKIFRLDTNKKK
jgi:hypothetical protein